ncbi:unnamed protein product [Clonostachys solani]|uniref:Uncharacterized protein n=1 Tax=Clonostachys solani TaxID=160281 RepID=A0A9P0EKD6_9HYPO|nr:unnamed protein product [Clonostachys solani]
MAPVLILVRHAQAIHNLKQDSSIHDPSLSDLGILQCARLEAHLKTELPAEMVENIGLILVSPMRRTIQTALRSMDWLLHKGVPIQASAGWQENSDHPCDTGTPISTLKEEFPQIDYSSLDPVFPEKNSQAADRYRYNRQAILARAQTCLGELYSLQAKAVIVVSHSGFLRQGVTGCWFDNADYRIFDIHKDQPANHFTLRQWERTKAGGLGLSWTEETELGQGLPEDSSFSMASE